MKYAWIKAHRGQYAINLLCEVLGVSINGYRAWVHNEATPAPRRWLTKTHALALITSVHAEVKHAYGSRWIHRELHARGYPIGAARGWSS